ncbi:MAG: hypothetical protein KHZ90_08215 [Veillonella parvula]|uniref:Uncharacterized protein n=1 Tax=Veillonella parvula TaxID=29466 RepID=A0A942WN32_VEIPA|nr:hypothetical protein [Veillonella parvula]MBS4893744.1 hypothetical protein [Veillonella parvula]
MDNKVIKFEDKDIQFAILTPNTYLIDNELVQVESYRNNNRVAVKDINNIRIVKENVIITGYSDGNETIDCNEYDYRRNKLLENANWDEYDECYTFEDLDEEFNYRKFIRNFKQITKCIQEISDPIKVEVEKTTYDTGNKYIKSMFLNGESKRNNLFVYDRESSWIGIVNDCFKELGMEYIGDCGYNSTNNKKVWGNSNHSCIRYVTAFGSYIFGDEFSTPYKPKGTLEDMLNLYERDKAKIEKIIKTKYNKHFGRIDAKDFDFNDILDKLISARNNLDSVQSVKKTENSLYHAKRKVNAIIEEIEMLYREHKENTYNEKESN